jgi:hypothetical protein
MPVIVDVLATDYHDQLYQRYAALRDEHPVYLDAARSDVVGASDSADRR